MKFLGVELPVRAVSNAVKVKVVLGREGPVRVGRLRGGCESSSAAACALASLFIGSLHLLLLQPTSHFYSIFFSFKAFDYSPLHCMELCNFLFIFFPTVWASSH